MSEASPQRRIPRVVHFIYGLKPQDKDMPFVHFASVATCRSIVRPDKIVLHLHHKPKGIWWQRTRVLIDEFRHVAIPTEWAPGKPIPNYAHKADFIRHNVLVDEGGIYLDIDTASVRPIDDLLVHETVLGREKDDGLCNAVMMCAPKALFMTEWLQRYPDVFYDGDWKDTSVLFPWTLSRQRPDLPLHIEPETSFFWPSWDHTEDIFENKVPLPGNLRILHLWENMCYEKYVLAVTGIEWARAHRHTLYGQVLLRAEDAWKKDGILYTIE